MNFLAGYIIGVAICYGSALAVSWVGLQQPESSREMISLLGNSFVMPLIWTFVFHVFVRGYDTMRTAFSLYIFIYLCFTVWAWIRAGWHDWPAVYVWVAVGMCLFLVIQFSVLTASMGKPNEEKRQKAAEEAKQAYDHELEMRAKAILLADKMRNGESDGHY